MDKSTSFGITFLEGVTTSTKFNVFPPCFLACLVINKNNGIILILIKLMMMMMMERYP